MVRRCVPPGVTGGWPRDADDGARRLDACVDAQFLGAFEPREIGNRECFNECHRVRCRHRDGADIQEAGHPPIRTARVECGQARRVAGFDRTPQDQRSGHEHRIADGMHLVSAVNLAADGVAPTGIARDAQLELRGLRVPLDG